MLVGIASGFEEQMTDSAIEAIPKKRREVIAGKYIVQYSFSAIAIASAVPLIEGVGTGLAGTLGMSSSRGAHFQF